MVCGDLQVQEYQTGATKVNMESVHSKEEVKRLKNQAQALRDKLNEQESKVWTWKQWW